MTSLSEQLKSSKSAGSRVIFIALKQEIMAAIGEGWTIKDAWNQLHRENKFPFTYALFVRHYNRFCRDKEAIKKQTIVINQLTPVVPVTEISQPKIAPQPSKPDSLIIVGKTKKNPFIDPDPLENGEDLI